MTLAVLYIDIDEIRPSEEYSKLIPPMTDQEYKSLKKSIDTDGIQVPLFVNHDFTLLDGYHRYKICKELGINRVPVLVR